MVTSAHGSHTAGTVRTWSFRAPPATSAGPDGCSGLLTRDTTQSHYLTSASHKQAHAAHLYKLSGPVPLYLQDPTWKQPTLMRQPSLHIPSDPTSSGQPACLLTGQPHEQQPGGHLEVWDHRAHSVPSSNYFPPLFETKTQK